MNWTTFLTILGVVVIAYNATIGFLYFKPELLGMIKGDKNPKTPNTKKRSIQEKKAAKRSFVGVSSEEQHANNSYTEIKEERFEHKNSVEQKVTYHKLTGQPSPSNSHTAEEISDNLDHLRDNISSSNPTEKLNNNFFEHLTQNTGELSITVRGEDGQVFTKQISPITNTVEL
jgi:hypothetical protein